jgi:hypothetical protein
VAESGGNHMHRDAGQQKGCRMDVAKIMQPGTR